MSAYVIFICLGGLSSRLANSNLNELCIQPLQTSHHIFGIPTTLVSLTKQFYHLKGPLVCPIFPEHHKS